MMSHHPRSYDSLSVPMNLSRVIRVGLVFSEELVTPQMLQQGLERCWHQVDPAVGTIQQLSAEIQDVCDILCVPSGSLKLSLNGLTLPPTGPTSLLREGDVLQVAPPPLPLTAGTLSDGFTLRKRRKRVNSNGGLIHTPQQQEFLTNTDPAPHPLQSVMNAASHLAGIMGPLGPHVRDLRPRITSPALGQFASNPVVSDPLLAGLTSNPQGLPDTGWMDSRLVGPVDGLEEHGGPPPPAQPGALPSSTLGNALCSVPSELFHTPVQSQTAFATSIPAHQTVQPRSRLGPPSQPPTYSSLPPGTHTQQYPPTQQYTPAQEPGQTQQHLQPQQHSQPQQQSQQHLQMQQHMEAQYHTQTQEQSQAQQHPQTRQHLQTQLSQQTLMQQQQQQQQQEQRQQGLVQQQPSPSSQFEQSQQHLAAPPHPHPSRTQQPLQEEPQQRSNHPAQCHTQAQTHPQAAPQPSKQMQAQQPHAQQKQAIPFASKSQQAGGADGSNRNISQSAHNGHHAQVPSNRISNKPRGSEAGQREGELQGPSAVGQERRQRELQGQNGHDEGQGLRALPGHRGDRQQPTVHVGQKRGAPCAREQLPDSEQQPATKRPAVSAGGPNNNHGALATHRGDLANSHGALANNHGDPANNHGDPANNHGEKLQNAAGGQGNLQNAAGQTATLAAAHPTPTANPTPPRRLPPPGPNPELRRLKTPAGPLTKVLLNKTTPQAKPQEGSGSAKASELAALASEEQDSSCNRNAPNTNTLDKMKPVGSSSVATSKSVDRNNMPGSVVPLEAPVGTSIARAMGSRTNSDPGTAIHGTSPLDSNCNGVPESIKEAHERNAGRKHASQVADERDNSKGSSIGKGPVTMEGAETSRVASRQKVQVSGVIPQGVQVLEANNVQGLQGNAKGITPAVRHVTDKTPGKVTNSLAEGAQPDRGETTDVEAKSLGTENGAGSAPVGKKTPSRNARRKANKRRMKRLGLLAQPTQPPRQQHAQPAKGPFKWPKPEGHKATAAGGASQVATRMQFTNSDEEEHDRNNGHKIVQEGAPVGGTAATANGRARVHGSRAMANGGTVAATENKSEESDDESEEEESSSSEDDQDMEGERATAGKDDAVAVHKGGGAGSDSSSEESEESEDSEESESSSKEGGKHKSSSGESESSSEESESSSGESESSSDESEKGEEEEEGPSVVEGVSQPAGPPHANGAATKGKQKDPVEVLSKPHVNGPCGKKGHQNGTNQDGANNGGVNVITSSDSSSEESSEESSDDESEASEQPDTGAEVSKSKSSAVAVRKGGAPNGKNLSTPGGQTAGRSGGSNSHVPGATTRGKAGAGDVSAPGVRAAGRGGDSSVGTQACKTGGRGVAGLPSDLSSLPPLSASDLCAQQVVAYQLLEIGMDLCPRVSDWRTGKVAGVDQGSIIIAPWPNPSTHPLHPMLTQLRIQAEIDGEDPMSIELPFDSPYDEAGVLTCPSCSFCQLRLVHDAPGKKAEQKREREAAAGAVEPANKRREPPAGRSKGGSAGPTPSKTASARASTPPTTPASHKTPLATPKAPPNTPASTLQPHDLMMPNTLKGSTAPGKTNGSGSTKPSDGPAHRVIPETPLGWGELAEQLRKKAETLARGQGTGATRGTSQPSPGLVKSAQTNKGTQGAGGDEFHRPRAGARRTAIGPLLSHLRASGALDS